MTQDFQKKWLKLSALVIGVFSPIFFFGTMMATAEPARFMIDLIAWPIDGQTNLAASETRFLSAIVAGFALAWGGLIWCLAEWVYDSNPEAVRKSVLVSVACWYVVDSLGSATSGYGLNVLFNTGFLIALAPPMLRSAKPLAA